MSRIITTLIILISVVTIMITSKIYTHDLYNEFNILYRDAEKLIENSQFEKAGAVVEQMIENLNTDRKIMMMFTDHEIIESLTIQLNKTASYIKAEQKSPASAELTEAGDLMSNIYAQQQFTTSNLF